MSVKIIFKEENEEIFWDFWQKYLAQTKVSSRYLKITLEQNIKFSLTKSLLYRDKSFVYVVNNEPVACVFLPIEKRGDYLMISHDINDGYVDAPLFKDNLIEKQIFTLIDEVAKYNKVSKINFVINPLEESKISFNYLQKHNYLDTSILKYIIDLNLADDLLSACRRGHKSDIKKILKDDDFKIVTMDKDNAQYEIHETYRKLHHKCAGRETRPKESFDDQFEKLKAGNALLAGLMHKNNYIAFSYFDYNSDIAIYASGADDPDYSKLPLYHALLFSAMQYFKKIGVRYIDVEQPSGPSPQFDYYPDDKQANIALFKRGFGGYFMNSFRGIKYFSKELFERDVEEFKENYSKNLINK